MCAVNFLRTNQKQSASFFEFADHFAVFADFTFHTHPPVQPPMNFVILIYL